MADRRGGHSSRRGGDRSHYDDRDRRHGHDRRQARDDNNNKDRHHQDRSRDHGRDRDKDRERERDHRRYRSRSRDKDSKDRRRSRSPGRERTYDSRRDDRDRGRDRKSYRREEPKLGNHRPAKDRGDGSVREDTTGRLDRPIDKPPPFYQPTDTTTTPHRSRSQSGSESPNRGFDHPIGNNSDLPTRSKPGATNTPAPPVSFKVKAPINHEERPLSRDGYHEGQSDPSGSRRFDDDPMDEDDEEEVVVEDDGLDAMAAMMGFGGFGTTKNKKVIGNNVGAVKKEKKAEYRQYMNRVGGFNRPLSPPR